MSFEHLRNAVARAIVKGRRQVTVAPADLALLLRERDLLSYERQYPIAARRDGASRELDAALPVQQTKEP